MRRTRIATIAVAFVGAIGIAAIFGAPEPAAACTGDFAAAATFVTAPV